MIELKEYAMITLGNGKERSDSQEDWEERVRTGKNVDKQNLYRFFGETNQGSRIYINVNAEEVPLQLVNGIVQRYESVLETYNVAILSYDEFVMMARDGSFKIESVMETFGDEKFYITILYATQDEEEQDKAKKLIMLYIE